MPVQVSMPLLLNLRTILILAALVCLCLSSNVGPRFFPLPATSQVALDVQLHQANSALYAPQADARSFRVPMMVQSKKRADTEPPQSEALIALPSERFGLSTDTRFAVEVGYCVCFFTTITMAPRAGRAPPSLV